MARSKHTVEQKIAALHLVEEGHFPLQEICCMYKIDIDALKNWRLKYETEGTQGLIEASTCKPYTKELKEAAVQDYLNHGLTMIETLTKYHISSSSVLKRWVRKYTSHSELKDSGKGLSKTMTKGRTTTVEERIEIAQDCMDNGRNYQATAEKFGVSYQQMDSWMKKLETTGEAALVDGRGRTKQAVELTEEDKLKLQIQQMARENDRLRAENLFLKKLEEIERRR